MRGSLSLTYTSTFFHAHLRISATMTTSMMPLKASTLTLPLPLELDALGLGGMMFWALSNDSNGDQSLISAASDLLMGGATPDEVMARSLQFDYVLGGDGQFGLDDFTLLA